MKIKLIRRVPTMKTEYFEIIGISRRFFVLPQRSFPTIFRQLSNKWIIKSGTSGTRSHILQVYNPLLYHCATLSLCETVWQYLFNFVSTVFSFVSTVLTFVSTVLTFVSTVFSFVSTLFSFVSTLFFFPQYVVKLRQYCVFFFSTLFIYPSILCFTSSVLC